YLIPAHAEAEIKKHGFAEAAKSFGISEEQLADFQDLHGTKSFNAVELYGMFTPEKRLPGPPRRDPVELQEAIDKYGKEGAAIHLGIAPGTLSNYVYRFGLRVDTPK